MAGNYAQLLDIINNPTDHSLPAWDNDNKLIEGLTIKQYLLTIIQSLTAGYQFMGVATPSTNPGTPDQNVFYIGGAGTYANFGTSITVPQGQICIFAWNGSWTNTPIVVWNADLVPTADSHNLIESDGVVKAMLLPDVPYSNCDIQLHRGYNSSGVIIYTYLLNAISVTLTGREKYISALNKATSGGVDYGLSPLFVFFDNEDSVISVFNGSQDIGKILCSEIPANCVKVGVNAGFQNITENKIRFFANDNEIIGLIGDVESEMSDADEALKQSINEVNDGVTALIDLITNKEQISVNILNGSALDSDFYSDTYYMTAWNLAKLYYNNPNNAIYIDEFQYIPPTGVNELRLCSITIDNNGVLQKGVVKEIIPLTSSMLVDGIYHVPINRIIDYIPGVYEFKYKNNISGEHQGYIATTQNIETAGTGANGEMGFGASGYLLSAKGEDIKPLDGKTINILGDSITVQHTYIDYMVNKQGCIVNNYGISGTTISSEFSDSFVSRYSAMTNDCDIVLVFGGINDWVKGGVLGTFENTNGNTFYSSLHALIGGLKDKYINGSIKKPIFVCTPLHSQYTLSGYADKLEYTITDGVISANSYGNGATLKEYVEAIRKVCEYYAVPVIDLYALSNLAPIQANNKSKYFADGLHPNSEGGKLIGNVILNEISRYIANM